MDKSIFKKIAELNHQVVYQKKEIARLNHLYEYHKKKEQEFHHLYMHYKTWMPPGHYYSPIPSSSDVPTSTPLTPPAAIDLNKENQKAVLDTLLNFYEEMPFTEEKKEGLRYYFNNFAYAYADGFFLHAMIRYAQPKKIIEIGSGFSSCMTLDTNELFFDNSIECTFIEPYPELFHSLTQPNDKKHTTLIEKKIQDVPVELFTQLEENDILFIDSTHVSKTGSDVNHEFFEIFPRLKKGVYIHLHDIFYPFEYPYRWLQEGRAWNENYLLRAFLMYNTQFSIVLWGSFMIHTYKELFAKKAPLCLKNRGGCIWLKKES